MQRFECVINVSFYLFLIFYQVVHFKNTEIQKFVVTPYRILVVYHCITYVTCEGITKSTAAVEAGRKKGYFSRYHGDGW